MSITDIISIGLGGISVFLGGYAVWQSWKYKMLGDKIERDQKHILQAIRDNSVYSAVEIRHKNEMNATNSNSLNLHKDKLYVYKTSKYKSCNLSEVIDKLNRELPRILKQTYIDSIVASLNLEDEDIEIISIATLRHQYEKEDLYKIDELNHIFSEDGIWFEIKMI